jgi:cell division protein FtsZ
VICLPNQRVFKLIDENTSLLEAFHITNELVAQGVRGIWRLLSRPGLINVDFADLCSVTRGKHAESCLVTAEAQGENRSREVMDKIMGHPLVEGGQVLTESAGVLVCIAGGRSLTMAEVNRIMEQINRQCEQAHIIMGAAVDEELGEKLLVTLVASRRGNTECGARSAEPHPGASRNADTFVSSAYSSGVELDMPMTGLPSKSHSRFVAPAPESTPDKTDRLLAQQAGSRGRKGSRMKQGQLPLEIISRGRFEKSEPTIYHGQDLDVPTYIRRGVALN